MLEPDEKIKLERALKLAEENNKMLKAMHRAQVWARVFRFVYWAVIIGLVVAGYFAIQPYLEQAQTLYEEVRGTVDGVKEGTAGLLEKFQ